MGGEDRTGGRGLCLAQVSHFPQAGGVLLSKSACWDPLPGSSQAGKRGICWDLILGGPCHPPIPVSSAFLVLIDG